MVDRRGLLLAGAAGALLAGCGGDDPAPAPAPDEDALTAVEVQGDVEVLGGLLELAAAGAALYAAPDAPELFARLLAHERAHARRLEQAIRARGAEPPSPLPADPGAGAPLERARRVESSSLAACVDALPKLADPELRELVAALAATQAGHLAAVDAALGRAAAPGAFVSGERQL